MDRSGSPESGDESAQDGLADTLSWSENEYPDPESVPGFAWSGGAYPRLTTDDANDNIRELQHEDYPGNSVRETPRSLVGRQRSRATREQDADLSSTSRIGDETDPAFQPSTESEISDNSPSSSAQSSEGEQTAPDRWVARRARGHVSRGAPVQWSRKGIKRGQRKPLEPSDEFKSLHARATMAFIDMDYELAEQLTLQAILMNPEMFAAHSLLSEIHTAKGDHDKALAALFNGAHTRPRDTQAWTTLAQLLLTRARVDNHSALTDALYCYSRIVSIDTQNIDARRQRAALNRRLGHKRRAALEYEQLLKLLPHDLTVLRCLAEIFAELGQPHRAVQHYERSIQFYRSKEPIRSVTFSWSDVNIFVELFAYQQQYEQGIAKIKSLSRWLLGRGGEDMWDEIEDDDREWDLEDFPRRTQVQAFRGINHDRMTYGLGLPLELHVKLGIYRLRSPNCQVEEAFRSFELLDCDDNSPNARVHDYPDLFRDVADALRDTGFYHEALRFYGALHTGTTVLDIPYYGDMAVCYEAIGLNGAADECRRTLVAQEQDRLNSQTGPMDLEVERDAEQCHQGSEGGTPSASVNRDVFERPMSSAMLVSRLVKQTTKRRESEKRYQMQLHEQSLRTLYQRTQELLGAARDGHEEALTQWMVIAQKLIDDFRSHRSFYPSDKGLKMYRSSGPSAFDAPKLQVDQSMQDNVDDVQAPSCLPPPVNLLAGRTFIMLMFASDDPDSEATSIAGDFRGIPFSSWLDLMLEYAVLLARSQTVDKAYGVLKSAKNANIFYCSPDWMFLIHVSCALTNHDEETLCSIARWFMKEFHLVTDGYRLFAAVNRLCHGGNTWFNCGPSQKYVLRQLKLMDSPAVKDRGLKSHDSQVDSDLDVSLLMLYGYILYMGRSYSSALNYFFRAFALDSQDPIVNLSLALAYIQHAIKRQSDNRHHLITQGLTFLFRYHDIRHKSLHVSERQEANFNVARAYHTLGLTHLAIPYYQRCLRSAVDTRELRSMQWDDFSAGAAFALRNIWAADDEMGKAAGLIQDYLVI
ncbi:MAG: hypothetical protein Q9220_007651 [cf. Caloplaca sp. 1 TL-2023]